MASPSFFSVFPVKEPNQPRPIVNRGPKLDNRQLVNGRLPPIRRVFPEEATQFDWSRNMERVWPQSTRLNIPPGNPAPQPSINSLPPEVRYSKEQMNWITQRKHMVKVTELQWAILAREFCVEFKTTMSGSNLLKDMLWHTLATHREIVVRDPPLTVEERNWLMISVASLVVLEPKGGLSWALVRALLKKAHGREIDPSVLRRAYLENRAKLDRFL